VYIPVTERADASTLAVVNLVKENLSRFQSVLPEDNAARPTISEMDTGLILNDFANPRREQARRFLCGYGAASIPRCRV
jgi:hypothetical protein